MRFPPTRLLRQLLRDELRQRRDEGCDTAELSAQLAGLRDDHARLIALYERATLLEPRADFPYHEPDTLPEIEAARATGATPARMGLIPVDETVADRIHGGWLGRCAGCALGKPLETTPFVEDPPAVKRYLLAAGAYPLDNFVPQDAAACRSVGLAQLACPASQRGRICCMEPDDDLRYTIMGLDILERCGTTFATADVAAWWLQHLPAAHCFTAEEAVYRNLLLLGAAHEPQALGETQWAQARTWLNPYREWIGAQIRADGWGLACPGDPARAAEFAWRDARLSHTRNGVYGEMFCAAMIATALTGDDPQQVVEGGLAMIPARSRLAEAIQQTIDQCRALGLAAERFEEALAWLWQQFGHYPPVHTINNAAAVVTALLLGGRNFERVITIAVMAGWDTDCNGATAGCICGCLLGARALPAKWTAPLNDTLLSEIAGFHPIAISECARRHTDVAQRNTRTGGA